MKNAYLARVPVTIDGQSLIVQFDYAAMAAIRTQIGDNDDLMALLRGADPEPFSRLVAIGLQRNHSDWSAQRVFDASPPIRPTVAAIEESLNCLYFGPNGPPKEATENPLMRIVRRVTRLFSRSERRSAQA